LIRGLSSFDFFERGDDKKKKFIKQEVYKKNVFLSKHTHAIRFFDHFYKKAKFVIL